MALGVRPGVPAIALGHGSFRKGSLRGPDQGNRAIQAAEELAFARASRSADDRTAYLRGAFQAAGSVTRPGGRGGYHLEFVHRDESFVRRVAEFSRTPMRLVRRRGTWVAYTKSADGVTTLLSQMGLHDAVLEYEARAVLGEAKANANRVTNFDAANAGRTATAAARQQRALEALDPGSLPPALKEMLELRLEQPRRLPGRTRSPGEPLQERGEPPPEKARRPGDRRAAAGFEFRASALTLVPEAWDPEPC